MTFFSSLPINDGLDDMYVGKIACFQQYTEPIKKHRIKLLDFCPMKVGEFINS